MKCRRVDYVQSHPTKLFISGHASCTEDRIIVRGVDTHIGSVFATVAPSDESSGIKYTYSDGLIAPSSTGSGFRTTPSSTRGSVKLRLAARRAACSLRMASRREGSFENSAKKAFSGLVSELITFRTIRQELRVRHARMVDAKLGPHVWCNKKRVQGQGRVVRTFEDFSCEAETSRAKRRLLVRGGDFSCEAETPRARRRLVV
jgi:hypothetical protein